MDTADQGSPSPAQATTISPAAQALTAAVSRDERAYPDDQPKAEAPEQRPPEDKSLSAPDAPADSEYQLQMPEGVQLDQELLTAAVPMLREAGISSDQASKLVPFVSQVQQRFHESQLDQFSELRASWAKDARSDREIGGEHWKETSRLAGVALHAGGAASLTHEARQLLDESGLGNHPSMLRLFRTMGAHIERLERQTGSRDPASREHRAYPDDPSR